MSNTHETPDDQNELPANELNRLKRQARTNALRLKIAQQNAALAALRSQGYSDKLEGYDDLSNRVDYRDYLFETPPFFGAIPTTRNDRNEGRDLPIFRTEQELAVIRGAARLITASNPIAAGVLASLTNYVIGNGFHYAVSPRDSGAVQLAKTASSVIEEFLEENNWSGDLDRELFQRSRVDGEYFLALFHVGNGRVQARAIEPDQVTAPTNPAGIDQWLGASQQTNWTFGVHSDCDDAQAVHGFYVQWTNRDQDWDYLPGGIAPIIPPGGGGAWMEHAKLNVVRSVKRGLSDFYPIQGNLEIARRVLRNMGEGSAVQAAIAWIQEMAPGTTQAQVNTGTMSRADASYTTNTQSGSRTHWLQQYDAATILKVPSGQKYLPGPLGAQNATSFITAAQALLRSVAVRWSLPENFVTGTAENNNFASSLVAESPFVKFAESQQQFYAQRDRRTLERVLWFAWIAGRFGDVEWSHIKRSLRIEITPPQIEVRDPEKETRLRKTLRDAGILSRKTWSAQEGLDFEQEQKNLQAEADSTPANSRPSTRPPGMAESLEQKPWDPSEHPRGGYPQNTGEFSPTGGSGSAPARNDSPQDPPPAEKEKPTEKEKLSKEDLFSYFDLLYGAKGKKLLKAFEDAGAIIKIEDVWFAKSDLDSTDAFGPTQIQIDETLNPAEAAQELMERLLEASGLTEVRQHLSHSGFDNIDTLIESYRQSFKQAAATTALAAELYLSGISVVNEGADWVVTIHDLSEGNVYAAIGFLPFVPAAVGKSGVILTHGKQSLRVSAETIRKIRALPVDELISLLESTRNLARNMEKAGIVRPPNTAAHHIVPVTLKKFKEAEAARAILTKFGIATENAANGVYLPSKFDNAVKAAYHGTLHTEKYYKELLRRLSAAKTKEDVLIVLDTIRKDLLAGNFPIN